MNYTKIPQTIVQQIALLKSRGLKIKDEKMASDFLSNVSSSRLSAFFLSFHKCNDPNHTYMPWASFERVIDLYVFDRELRIISIDVIERIEVSLRCKIVYEYSTRYGSHWYENKSLFSSGHEKIMDKIILELKRSKEVFISHYKQKYSSPKNPPAWMTLEILSLGQLSFLYKNLLANDAKKAVSDYFGLHHTLLESWIEHLAYVRNLAAHHSRLWNKTFTIKATIPKITAFEWIEFPPSKNDKIYTTICIMAYLIKRIRPESTFTGKIKALLLRHKQVDINAAGFNKDWKRDPFWKNMHLSWSNKIRIEYYRYKYIIIRRKTVS